jgi:hypothetical protein
MHVESQQKAISGIEVEETLREHKKEAGASAKCQ